MERLPALVETPDRRLLGTRATEVCRDPVGNRLSQEVVSWTNSDPSLAPVVTSLESGVAGGAVSRVSGRNVKLSWLRGRGRVPRGLGLDSDRDVTTKLGAVC